MNPPDTLTPLQLALLRILWKRGEARVAEVHAALSVERDLALSTVATLLRRLEKRGLVAHETEGRQFVYRALVDVDETRSRAVGELTEHHFEGDVPALVAHLLARHELESGDLERVRKLIQDAGARHEEDGANARREKEADES